MSNKHPIAKFEITEKNTDNFYKQLVPEPNTGCWLWTGVSNRHGYGLIYCENKVRMAHRYSFLLHNGYIDDLYVLHKCDTPSCVNPDHLYLGTAKDNANDVVKRGRNYNTKRILCKRGHKLDTVFRKSIGKTRRYCKTCDKYKYKYDPEKNVKRNARRRELNLLKNGGIFLKRKISWDEVLYIRSSQSSAKKIAEELNISIDSVYDIKRFITRKTK